MKTHTLRSVGEMERFVKGFLKIVLEQASQENATLVFLSGDLGSGKTAFTRALARKFGIKARVTSPTFVIEKRYKIPKTGQSKFQNLVHIDAYRLEGETADVLGIEHDFRNPKNLICIEWPENLSLSHLKPDFQLFFEFVDEGTRKIDVRCKISSHLQ